MRQLSSIALLVALWSLSVRAAPQGTAAPSQDMRDRAPAGASQNSSAITCNVVVFTHDRRYVTGLLGERFAISVDEEPTQARFDGQNVPTSVLILVDVSGSITRGKTERANQLNQELRQALAAFFKFRTSACELAVATFAEQPTLLADYTKDSTTLVTKLEAGIAFHGRTALLDTCDFALEVLARGTHQRKVLIILTDGEDNKSRSSIRAVRHKLERTNVVVYAVELPTDVPAPVNAHLSRDWILRDLADETGGVAVTLARRSTMAQALAGVAQELNYVYSFTIMRSDAGADKRHKVQVRIVPSGGPGAERKELQARTRKAFRL